MQECGLLRPRLTVGIARKFGGAFGLGIQYAKTMFDNQEDRRARSAKVA